MRYKIYKDVDSKRYISLFDYDDAPMFIGSFKKRKDCENWSELNSMRVKHNLDPIIYARGFKSILHNLRQLFK